MADEKSRNDEQTRSPSRVNNAVLRGIKVDGGPAFLLLIYKAIVHKFGWQGCPPRGVLALPGGTVHRKG